MQFSRKNAIDRLEKPLFTSPIESVCLPLGQYFFQDQKQVKLNYVNTVGGTAGDEYNSSFDSEHIR